MKKYLVLIDYEWFSAKLSDIDISMIRESINGVNDEYYNIILDNGDIIEIGIIDQIKECCDENLILKITERCEVSYINEDTYNYDKEKEYISLRNYLYESHKDNFEEAVVDFINNFDSNNIYNCHDEFDGECLNSEVIKIEMVSA